MTTHRSRLTEATFDQGAGAGGIMFGAAYISRQIDIHPSDVIGIITQWHHGLQPVRCVPRWCRLEFGLWLASEANHRSADPLQLYAVPGILWNVGRPFRVFLEFSIWSDSLSAVGIRPNGIYWPVGTERYARRIAAALDAVSVAALYTSTCGLKETHSNALSTAGKWHAMPALSAPAFVD
jgi:hypothetical protein